MKSFSYILLTSLLALTQFPNAGEAVNVNVSEEEIAADNVFAPLGFDNNDSSELIVTGMLRNLCYKAPKATAQVIGNQIRVTVTALHVRAPGGYCAQMAVPFQEVIELGVLPSANYQVVVASQPPTTPLNTSLSVVEASTSSIDDFVYASVDWIETFKDSRKAVLHGYNPSDCYELDAVQLVSNNKDAYSVLPIMKQVNTTCPLKMVPFSYEFQVPRGMTASQILLHTRVLNGKSVNKIFFNTVE
jgi:hypothetical protein